MKIIIGLGNLGLEYINTKHNIGFMIVDKLAEQLQISSWKKYYNMLIAETIFNNEQIVLVKPQTFMNSSGEVLIPLKQYCSFNINNLIIAYDDLDLPIGTVRLRAKGSSGGHRGIRSIMQYLNDEQNFIRIKIGIGRPDDNQSIIDYVLSSFIDEDYLKIEKAINYAVEAIIYSFQNNIDKTMSLFNKSV